MKQISIRSVIVGIFVGSLMCMTNMYFGLQSGWITMGSLQSAILGYGIFKLLNSFGWASGFSIAENVIVQTTSVATATMPLAAGFVGVIPALGKLTTEENPPDGAYNFSHVQLIIWTLTLAFFGVFVAIPLRTQVIEREKLKFPSGTATAQVINTLHRNEMDENEERHQSALASRIGPCEGCIFYRSGTVEGFRVGSTQQSLTHDHGRQMDKILLSSSLSAWIDDDQHTLPLSAQAGPVGHHDWLLSTRQGSMVSQIESPREKAEPASVDVSSIQQAWVALGSSFLAAFLLSAVAAIIEIINEKAGMHVPTTVNVFGAGAAQFGWTIGANAGYIGQGMIMGPRVCFSMAVGAIVGFGMLAPMAVDKGWASQASGIDGFGAWVSWIAMCIMIADSITSLLMLLIRYGYRLSVRYRIAASQSYGEEQALTRPGCEESVFNAASELPARQAGIRESMPQSLEPGQDCETFPVWLPVIGILVSIAVATGVFADLFPMPHWQIAAAMGLALFVAVLAVRALGETDLNPVSGIGKLTQVIFALLAPGKVLQNLVAGAISEAAAAQAGEMMQDFKTAYLLGVCPKCQFLAALLGSLASCWVSTAAYMLFDKVYDIGGPKLPAPTAAMLAKIWLDMARLVTGGQLPSGVIPFCWAGGVFGALSAMLPDVVAFFQGTKSYQKLPSSHAIVRVLTAVKWAAPSGVGFAIGMYILPKFVIPRLIGGVLGMAAVWTIIAPPNHRGNMMLTASGLVLGEGIASMAFTFLKLFLQ